MYAYTVNHNLCALYSSNFYNLTIYTKCDNVKEMTKLCAFFSFNEMPLSEAETNRSFVHTVSPNCAVSVAS